MSFWRSLNKGFNNVLGTVGGIAAATGIPVVSGIGGITQGIIAAGQSGGQTVLPPEVNYQEGGGAATSGNNSNFILYAAIAAAAYFLILKKK